MRHSASRKRHGRRKASAGNRRRLLLLPALLLSLVLGLPSGALAYWTSTGGGSSTGSSGDVIAPSNVSIAQVIGQRTVAVAWSPSVSPNVSGYRVERSSDGGASWTTGCGGAQAASATGCNDTGLTEGAIYVVRVTALKGSWTATSATSSPVKIDTTKPTVAVDRASAQPASTRLTPITFSIGFGEPVVGFSASSVTLTLGGTVVSGNRQLTALSPTSYTLAVDGITADGQSLVATIAAGAVADPAGNTNTASTTSIGNSVLLDNVKPSQPVAPHLDSTVLVDTGVSQTDNITKANALVIKPNGTVAADAPVGTVVTLYRADSSSAAGASIATAAVSASGGVSSYSFTLGSDQSPASAGSHWYYVTYTDAAGNISADGARQNIVVDRTAPAAPTVSANRPFLSATATVSGTYSTAGNDAGAITVYMCTGNVSTCSSNPQSPTTMSGGLYSLAYDLGLLGALLGSYTSTVTLTDIAGNTSAASRVTF